MSREPSSLHSGGGGVEDAANTRASSISTPPNLFKLRSDAGFGLTLPRILLEILLEILHLLQESCSPSNMIQRSILLV